MKTLIPLTATPDAVIGSAYEVFLNRLPVRRPSRILFINIPQVPADIFSADTARLNGYHIYPPIGYLYLAAAARNADPDIDLRILDLNYEMLRQCHQNTLPAKLAEFWKPLVAEAVGDGRGLHVCVGNMFEATSRQYLDIVEHLKAVYPHVTVISGGVQVTLDYKEILERGLAHLVIRHEAEDQFTAFLRTCAAAEPLALPDGLAFTLDGVMHETAGREGVGEFLDIREFYDLIDISSYYKYGGVNPYSRYVGKERPFGTVLSNRGCRAQCTFCGVESFNGRGVRRRTARSVVDEIKHLMQHKGIEVIEWLDDDLLYGRQQSAELFKLMAEELPGLEWIANNGVIGGAVNDEIMHWMVASGCKAFKVGIESGNEAMLRKIKKPGTKSGLRQAGSIFSKYPQVFVSANFIVGFPEETVGEMLDSYHFADELRWDWANYYICQPLPGTDMFDAFQSMGDDRCGKDDYKVYNPGKSVAQKGNFGYYKGYHTDDDLSNTIKSGRDIFDLPRDLVPTGEQIKEIWFSFNLLSNFINNRNFQPGGNPLKIVRWFESIAASYPRDAAMCAMLAHGHDLVGNQERAQMFRDRFKSLVDTHDYWKRRVEEFPELLRFAAAGAVC